MSQKTSKTLFYMKIMVCKIPPGGSETLSGQWPIRHGLEASSLKSVKLKEGN